MDDNELMLRVRAGDKEAYEILIKKYMKQAISFACQYVRDSYAAEDIVQESFADIYMQRFEFDQRYKFSTYLFAIIKNKARNYLKRNREIVVSDFAEETERPVIERTFITEDTPETVYFQKAELQEVHEAIKKLKKEEQNILYLYAVEECSYKEIAVLLGQSVVQIKIKLFRARKKIRERGRKDHG